MGNHSILFSDWLSFHLLYKFTLNIQDMQAWANIVDPDQMLQAASDQGLQFAILTE